MILVFVTDQEPSRYESHLHIASFSYLLLRDKGSRRPWTCGIHRRYLVRQGRDVVEKSYHCSAGKKGFAISSDPSTGLRTVIVGPRRTVKPRERMWGSGNCSSSVTSSRTRFKS